jgi:hypothetical protein
MVEGKMFLISFAVLLFSSMFAFTQAQKEQADDDYHVVVNVLPTIDVVCLV